MMQAVLDTGSFEVLVFGERCVGCGNKLYDSTKSSSYKGTNLTSFHQFGSGDCDTHMAYENVSFDGIVNISDQYFWQVDDAVMSVATSGNWQAIIGLGLPGHVRKEAHLKSEELQNQLADQPDMFRKFSVNKLKKQLQLEKAINESEVILESTPMTSFSFCLREAEGSPGVMIWHDHPAFHNVPWTQLKVTDDGYWSVQMENLELYDHSLSFGCSRDKPCAAVVDSGTSLMAVPNYMYNQFKEILSRTGAAGEDCDDLAGLPDLCFSLDGHRYCLPPDSYVGIVAEEQEQMLWGLWERRGPHPCQLLVTAFDSTNSAGHDIVILGMPFLRQFYTSFVAGTTKDDRALYTAIPDDDCYPSQPHYILEGEAKGPRTRIGPGSVPREHRPPRRVDMSRALLPDPRRSGPGGPASPGQEEEKKY